MKILLKKILLSAVLFLVGFASAQNYPNNNNSYNNQYEYYYDDYQDYPDDYFYEYPQDYYTQDLYRGYYNDYRRAISSINWSRFFMENRLSAWQVREIQLLNRRFSNYNSWLRYYRFNPDRWYYDRFIAMERILGPRIYVNFYQRYYNNYNPIVYFRNYRVQKYRPTVYVTPKYRNSNESSFRNDDFRKGSFKQNQNSFKENNNSLKKESQNFNNQNGFRDRNENNKIENSNGFRDNTPKKDIQKTRENIDFRSRESVSPQNKSNESKSKGFR